MPYPKGLWFLVSVISQKRLNTTIHRSSAYAIRVNLTTLTFHNQNERKSTYFPFEEHMSLGVIGRESESFSFKPSSTVGLSPIRMSASYFKL
jgi:hypothetical protein